MRGSSEAAELLSEVEFDGQNTRRIRHVTSIQVRNLTPFPVRDAFASAMKQPSEQPQFTPHGHLSDDLDLTLGRKRARRTSSTSNITLSGLNGAKYDGEIAHHESDRPGETGARRRTLSRASTSSNPTPSGPNLTRRMSTVGGAPAVRPPYRQRTISIASSSTALTGDLHEVAATSKYPDLLQNTSQRSLENVLESRLVETFLTIALPTPRPPPDCPSPDDSSQEHSNIQEAKSSRVSTPSPRSSGRGRASTSVQKSDMLSKASTRRSTVTASSSNMAPARPTTPSKLNTPASPSTVPRSGSRLHAKSSSTSLPSEKVPKSPTSPPAQRQRPPIPPSLVSPPSSPSGAKLGTSTSSATSPSPLSTPKTPLEGELPVPDYISPIHRPSTNPKFQLDTKFGREFVHGVDLSGSRMRVEVWGHVKRGLGWASAKEEDTKGKGRERDLSEVQAEWKVLEGWDVDLKDLVTLPENLASHPSHLPSNSLLVTLSPPGRTFYLPMITPDLHELASVTDSGYNSDPESVARKTKGAGELVLPGKTVYSNTKRFLDDVGADNISESEDYGTFMRKGRRRTATWQDLLRLINLQACILDSQQSLSSIVREIDRMVTQPGPSILRREVSEREAWIGQLGEETSELIDASEKLRSRIVARRTELRQRREILALARQLNDRDSEVELEQEEELADEQERLDSLRNQTGPMRSVLLTTLSFIFPIELVSPPDLLFTILDVPLPIPIAATDPAPPLSLPSHKEVTEEAVATALGYAAQVVQLLAAYMGKGLVYPVTCVGSRSLIKDGISAMVGPRMFPLFSRGVDTYRFEYGVFLLNKDIELLMSDRNLRALDMRHTLPNLKNLLLTLTDSEHVRPQAQRFSMASSASISSLQSPILTASTLPSSSEAATPTAAQPGGLPVAAIDVSVGDHDSPSPSGSSTPTTSSARKSRAFLDLAPLAGFLRARYPSSSRPSVRSVPETPEGTPDPGAPDGSAMAAGEEPQQGTSAGAVEDEEDDRRTIRGRGDAGDTDAEEVEEGKSEANGNGNGNGHAALAGEKVVGEDVHEHAARPPAVRLLS